MRSCNPLARLARWRSYVPGYEKINSTTTLLYLGVSCRKNEGARGEGNNTRHANSTSYMMFPCSYTMAEAISPANYPQAINR